MHLVIGLGNPGRRYERTRHNAGFLVVDRLAERVGARVERKQLGALVDSIRVPEVDDALVLAKPQGFMNLSGQPAASLRGYYKVRTEDVVVVHDDVDLEPGRLKLKQGGGDGGHKGIRSMTELLGSADFIRLRFGVGRPPSPGPAGPSRQGAGSEVADFVLSPFGQQEQEIVMEAVKRSLQALDAILGRGLKEAMNRFNRPPKPVKEKEVAAAAGDLQARPRQPEEVAAESGKALEKPR